MKKLTTIKLINWHYFVNETIELNNNVLVTGENGAGKSTLLDAIQYVLTAGHGKFNTAANMNTKRTLESYVRCKIGTDARTYLRNDDVTSHIALQFTDEVTKQTFLIGAVIDIYSTMSREKVLFYTLESKLSDDLFLQENGVPRDIKNFKARVKGLSHQYQDRKRVAKGMILNRLGQLDHKYFDLLTKALAFRPIDDVKDFVYQFVLDEKEIHIDHLRNNIRLYRELQKTYDETKESVSRLEEIQQYYDRVIDQVHKKNRKTYVVYKGKFELSKQKVSLTEQSIKRLHVEYDQLSYDKVTLLSNEESLKREYDEINGALLRNESYQRRRLIEGQMNELKTKLSHLQGEINKVKKLIERERKRFGFLINYDESLEEYRHLLNLLSENIDTIELTDFDEQIDLTIQCLKERNDTYIGKRHKLKQELQQVKEELVEIGQTIKQLEKKKLPYRNELTRLRELIEMDLKRRFGRDIPVHVFCELLEVKDEKWRNAIEGYLNTQRFDLIVEPEYFDHALRVYERYKFEEKIYGVGLVNVEKITNYGHPEPNSLATKVASESFYATCYANMILNKVQCCESVDELKHHYCAITPTCMVYQNHTARQISEKIYKKPYIGQSAILIQLEENQKRKAALEHKQKELDVELKKIEAIIQQLSTDSLFELKRMNERIQDYRTTIRLLHNKEQELSQLPVDETILDLQTRLDRINELIKQNRSKIDNNNKRQGNIESKIEQLNVEKEQFILERNQQKEQFLAFQASSPEVEQEAEDEYANSIQKDTLEKVISNAEYRERYYELRVKENEEALKNAQLAYNITFQFGGAIGLEGIDQYREKYYQLVKSDLLKYEDELRELKQKTELEFKEQFIARLQENIREAQKEFNQLNRALKDKQFGSDSYSFECKANPKYKQFYDMIMDEDNIEGLTLFSEHFTNRHQSAINELFDRITIDDDAAEQAVSVFTDYRTYLDYDIKIHHANGETSSFSKVNREKSGGETQTPFYVIIAASFIQLFNNANNPARLVLFDEAFNNMDEGRIETMMKFYRSLNLQTIIAVPSQRMDTIQPYVDSTIVVLREDTQAFVTNFDVIGDLDEE